MSTNLTVTLGRDDRFDLQALGPDGETPLNLTGCTVLFGARLHADADLALALGPGAGVTITTAATGHFTVVVPRAAKAELSALTFYAWDVVVVDALGLAVTPYGLSGFLYVEESITPYDTDPVPAYAALSMTPNFSYHPEIVTLEGDDATSLLGYDPTLLARPAIFVLRIAGLRQEWLCRTRTVDDVLTDTETVPETEWLKLIPNNFHATNLNVLWERIA